MSPLSGITVVTLEHAIAAPLATRHLADFGARVIKVERPETGDFARGYDERVRGLASHFVWTNRSKESLTLDVKHPEAQRILGRLIREQADVVVQNLAPGAGDGKVVMLGLQNEREWATFCTKALRQPALAEDGRFSTNSRRSAARAELHALIVGTFATMTAAET